MSTETNTPPVAPVAATPPALTPNQSPRLPVPANAEKASAAAVSESAKKLWGAAPPEAEHAQEPVKPADQQPKPPVSQEPPSIIKKEDAPPPVAPVEHPEDKLAEPATESAKAGWKELKAIAKEQRNRASTLEAQIAELKKSAPNPTQADATQLEGLKAQLKEAHDRLLILDLQHHPDFVNQYVQPKSKALDVVKEVLGYNERAVPDLGSLLAKPLKDFNAALSEMTKDMNSADTTTVVQSFRQARDLHAQEQSALAKAGDVHQQLTQRTQAAQKQAFESVAKEVVPNFQKRPITPEMSAEERGSAEAYNQSVDSIRAAAEQSVFGKVGEKQVAEMGFKAAALDHMLKHAVPYLESYSKSQNQTIADLRAELAALKGGKAPPSGGGDPENHGTGNETIADLAKATWRK